MTTHRFGSLDVEIHSDGPALGRAAAEEAAAVLKRALDERPVANLMLATGASQFDFLAAFRENADVDFARVNVFHMDEYVGLGEDHPASFRRYLLDRFVQHARPRSFHGVVGDAPDAEAECARYEALLREHPLDLVCMGIGENGHLAFNDPPDARFDDPAWVRVVRLDERSRRQQVGEGFFPDLDAVPERAITVTIPGLLAATRALVIVPEGRKAGAVRAALQGPVTPAVPASILRRTPHAKLYLDRESAKLLDLVA